MSSDNLLINFSFRRPLEFTNLKWRARDVYYILGVQVGTFILINKRNFISEKNINKVYRETGFQTIY